MEKLLEIVLSCCAVTTTTICDAIAIYLLCTLFTKTNYPKKKIFISSLIMLPFCALHFIIATKFSNLSELMPIIAFLTCLPIVCFLYKPTKLNTIFILLSYFVFMFAMDIYTVLFITILGKDVTFLTGSIINYSLTLICANILDVVLLFLIYHFFYKKHKGITSKENYKYILYQSLAIIICLIPSMYLMFSNFYDYPIIFVIVNALQLVIVSAFSIIYLKKGIKFKDTELELENTKLHNKALSTINENIRGFKHDMGNMVQAINGYLAVGNIDDVKAYCKNLLHGFNDINLLSILSPKIINDPAIYGIVVSKMLEAREKDLTLSLDIGIDVSSINFPSFELSRIIGILLDNAIEASQESDERKLKLEMYYDENRKCDVIIIGNSVKDPSKVDIIRMFDKDYSTKENPSGFGLYEVLKFFKKNNKGDIVPNIDYDTNFFTQTLTFDK